MFRVYSLQGEPCDKCNELLTDDNPGMGIEQRGKFRERNIIFVHLSCLNKAIAKVTKTKPEVEN